MWATSVERLYLQGRILFQKNVWPLLSVGLIKKEKRKVDPFPRRAQGSGEQTGSHKSCVLLQKCYKNQPSVSIFLELWIRQTFLS